MIPVQPTLTLNRAQAADRLGVSKTVFDGLVKSGRLRVIRAGRRMLIPDSELSAFLMRELEQAAQ